MDHYEPISYVNEHFSDSKILFGVEAQGNPFYVLYGGDNYYPFTVIIDADGIITLVYRSSMMLTRCDR